MACPAASLPPSNSRRIAPGPGLIGFDGGTKRAITMAVQPVNDYVFVQEGDCFGLNCKALTITFANLTPCPDSGIISYTGVNGSFDIGAGTDEDFGCFWSPDTGFIGTVTITDGMGGSTTHNLDLEIACFSSGPFTGMLFVNMFETPDGNEVFTSGSVSELNGPNQTICGGSTLFSGGTFSIP